MGESITFQLCYNTFMKTTKENILHYLKEIKPELEEYGINKEMIIV